jgi:hypothetical protein
MDSERARSAAEAIKSAQSLAKTLKTDVKAASVKGISQATKVLPSGLPEAIKGSGLIGAVMYFVAGVLVIGVILLMIDYWVHPIFKDTPGGAGYVMIPGTDKSELYWETPKGVRNIIIGLTQDDETQLSTSLIEAQTNYSITLDVLINDEYPQQTISPYKDLQRTFFAMGPSIVEPSMTFSLDNQRNTVYINVYDKNARVQTAVLDNVPVHTPFRIGIVKSPYAMEAYLNGLLVKTIQLRSSYINPTTGDQIFAPSNIIYAPPTKQSSIPVAPISLATGIKALNLRLFPTSIDPIEMQARMSDLASATEFTSGKKNSVSFSI